MSKPKISEFNVEDGYTEYRYAGRIHRVDGPAVTYDTGQQQWYRHGYLHRVDGPAVIYENGDEEWFRRSKLHRVDGPAVILKDAQEITKYYWFLFGTQIKTPEQFRKVLGLSKEQISFIMLKWGWFK